MKCEGRNRWDCHREATVEIDGLHLCGPHAAGKRRSNAAREASVQRYVEKQEYAAVVLAQAQRLTDTLGVIVLANYQVYPEGRYDGRMIVPADFLEGLVKP